ncbi:MAG: glycosyltransferase family 87 protein [Candidatus Aminicenantales bacterium]
MSKKRFRAAALILLIISLAALFGFRARKDMVDFEVNYTAGARMRAGETLYRQEDGHYQFKYAPFSAFLYVPLSVLPLDAAKAVWFCIVLSSSILLFTLSSRLVRTHARPARILRFLPPLILSRYFLRELQLGQINALITFLLVAMTALLVRKETERAAGREGTAGLLWGLGSALKPYSLIFLPYWVLKRKMTILFSGVFVLAAAFAAPALYFGFPGNIRVHEEWISSLSRSTPSLLSSQDNVSLIALFTKWTGRPAFAQAAYPAGLALIAGLILFLLFRGKRLGRPEVLESALLCALIPIVSPLGWDYTLLSSVLAVTLVLEHFPAFPRAGKALLIANFLVMSLSLYDVLGRSLYARYMALSVPTVNILILVGFLAWLRIKGRA